MLELKVADSDVTGGNIAVSWCVDHELIKQLADSGIADPQLVICVAPASLKGYSQYKEVRKVVSLNDLMTYIDFRVPGENNIWAFISTDSKRDTKNFFLKRSNSLFETDVLSYDGQELFRGKDFLKAAPLSVMVPNEVFAKEPAQWEKDWVNHLFRSKPIDQCHFRRRRLFAYTV